LYNYYREAYPDAYPLYKTFAFLFPKGDKRKGLKELEIASQNSIFLKAESASFLASIDLSFDNDYPEAAKYSGYLHNLYPSNIAYLAAYIKSLLLVKQYDEAEKLIKIYGPVTTSSYFQAQLEIFNGILNEKKYSDPDSAERNYNGGIKSLAAFGKYGLEYTAYAYFGLSRIYSDKGDRKSSKIFRKKALELADFKKIDFD
jgi:tetratricopeptide (TPR) repeat protein